MSNFVPPSFPFSNQQSQSFSTQGNVFLPADSLHQSQPNPDLNSPAAFQQNIQIAQEQVARLQTLARNTLAGIQNSYHPVNSPVQTEANVVALKQTIQSLSDLLWQSGVGALPVLPISTHGETLTPPTEQQMLADANKSIRSIYEELQRMQDSAAVVANLLAAPDRPSK